MVAPHCAFQVFPTSKCKLRLLKLERIKDFLLMEEEFIRNQEVRGLEMPGAAELGLRMTVSPLICVRTHAGVQAP